MTFTRNKRLKILEQNEIKELYSRPRFSDEERAQYFTLTPAETEALNGLHSVKSKITFILHLGYFKARRLFFVVTAAEAAGDIGYIINLYFSDFVDHNITVTKHTRLKHQRLILDICQYKVCDDSDRRRLETKACEAAVISSKPIYVFRQVLLELEANRLAIPGYSFLQDTVGKALNFEQNRLANILQQQLTDSDKCALNALLDDKSSFYLVTHLKHTPKDFSATEIKVEVSRGKEIKELYKMSQRVLPALGISNESIKYYASLVGYYSVFRLSRFEKKSVYIYLLCFIHHRYQQHYDNLLAAFIFYVRKFTEEAKSATKERIYQHRVEANQNLYKAATILKLFTKDDISEQTLFHDIQKKAFAILERDKLDQVVDQITSQITFDEKAFQWEQIERLSSQFKRYLRPLLSSADIGGSAPQSELIKGIDFLKGAIIKGRSLAQYPPQKIPTNFISSHSEKYLYKKENEEEESRKLIPNRYEFYVYRLLRDRLEAGDIYCCDSVRFRSFEDDLIDDTTWQTKKDDLIERAGLLWLKRPVEEHLRTLENELEDRLEAVNKRIENGENHYIKVNKKNDKSRWSLKYPTNKDEINHPIFDTLSQVNISSVLGFVNERCHFMDAFTHVLDRYVKTTVDERSISATLLGWGTNTGLGRMGQISDISYTTLTATSDNFFRLETLKAANDLVTNDLSKLSIFHEYDIDDRVHSSSDGQKFETKISTINARHSPKYFGLKKGIVAYTLVANHIPINARIIGANEHESHYVFDVLFNNTSKIQPEIHSTDTHGSNAVNFAILKTFGYQFAPRYADIAEVVKTSLYGFKHPSHYKGLIKPIRKIRKSLIIDNWDCIQRIMVSLALKTTTQSIITGKLSSYARKNKTRTALWEYDNIHRSLYFLRFIDEPSLRRNVQLALNRGESYNKLRRAVAFANFGKLRFKNENEQQLWQECSRLITNCIIYYNATILSNLMTYRKSVKDIEGAAQLQKISPVAWQHINLHGRYEFTKNQDIININEIIRTLEKL